MSQTKRVVSCVPALRSLLVPIDQISADPANLRKHGERSIEAVIASYRRFGQQKPIVIDAGGVTIAGAGQLEAARRMGWTHIAAVRSGLAGVDRVGYAIADNRSAELSSWDEDALAATLGAMTGEDLAVTGFSAADITELSGGESLGVVQDEIPEVTAAASAVSRAGELWQLGEHRLLVGDCTVEADVLRVMGGMRAALVATDPPYLVGYDGMNHPQSYTGGANKDWSDTYAISWDDNDPKSPLYRLFIAMGVKHAGAPDAAWYIWHASKRQAMLEEAMQAAGLLVHCQIIWAKNRPVLTRSWYMWQHEPCLMGWVQGNKPPKRGGESQSTVWNIDTIPNGEERPEHPTPKPLEVYSIPIQQHTVPGELLYEPFAGSGTAIIASEQLGRRCRAIEKQPVYVDVCIRRWQKLTGNPARLDGDGRTFDEISQERAACPAAPSSPATTPAADPSPPRRTAKPTKSSTSPGPGKAPKGRRTAAAMAPTGDGSEP